MATEFSFDIVSEVDRMEVKNAFQQAVKELANRYDFKGSSAAIEESGNEIILTAEDDFRLSQVRDILFSKLVKREISAKMVEYGTVEPAKGMTVRQAVSFKEGLKMEEAKALSKMIKDEKFKVNSQVQGEQVRVSGKSKDDLQKVMAYVKGLDLPYAVKFTNFR
ncbi:MAG: YajQ family cyclic di-GMP-binding protein [Armatimonadetes bacterium]|nr:YajQ family cyclic di-GMP-binding protein [Armatimonadota bacterium]MBS1711853.1 YajQ family cyclic di-GMP-binding protein [Armatimonadota bacterium]MBX3109593.1 YajQ family cyclic di-GMP-binding protein [Fimbriimonadaceae bacterium]